MKKKHERSDETLSILKHLRKNQPPQAQEEELEIQYEEGPDDHPILKKKKPTKIF